MALVTTKDDDPGLVFRGRVDKAGWYRVPINVVVIGTFLTVCGAVARDYLHQSYVLSTTIADVSTNRVATETNKKAIADGLDILRDSTNRQIEILRDSLGKRLDVVQQSLQNQEKLGWDLSQIQKEILAMVQTRHDDSAHIEDIGRKLDDFRERLTHVEDRMGVETNRRGTLQR